MRTAQEIFDRVARHMLTQKKRAYGQGKCLYHTSDGLQCAVGALIDVQRYKPFMECGTIRSLISTLSQRPEYADMVEEFSAHEDLLSWLQSIHDGGVEITWESQLRNLAQKHNLQFNP